MSGGGSVSARVRAACLSASGGLPRLIHVMQSHSAYRGAHTGVGGIGGPLLQSVTFLLLSLQFLSTLL